MKWQSYFMCVVVCLCLSESHASVIKTLQKKTDSLVRSVSKTAKKGKDKVVSSAHTIKQYFSDPALGNVYYYSDMGDRAFIIQEKIPGAFAINALYYKFYPRTIRQWLQWQGTHVEFNNWWRKISHWYKNETGVYDGADIKAFITAHSIDMSDYLIDDPALYPTFNHFFYRRLKDGVRKIDERESVVSAPVDGKLRVLENLSNTSKFFIKQKPFNLEEFLQDERLARDYEGGTLLTFRLAPSDYHRFHFPFDCIPSAPVLLKGDYETVSPIAFRAGLWPISVNKRARIILHSDVFQDVLMVVVGASMVASLNFTYKPSQSVSKGSEAGFFAFGGSTVCLLFKKDAIVLPALLSQRSNHTYLYAKKPFIYERDTAFETAVLMGQGVAMKTSVEDVDSLSDYDYLLFLDKKNRSRSLIVDDQEISFSFNSSQREALSIPF